VVANAGGKAGGAAVVTPRGLAVIRAFRDVEREIGAALSRLEAGLAASESDAGQALGDLFWSLGLRTSARNALRGTVAAIEDGEVTARVALDLGDGVEIASIITRRSREELALAVGKPALALIKSSFVVLAGDGPPEAGINRLVGTVVDREDGHEVSEVTLSLSAGKTLVATVPNSARPPAVGDQVVATVAPSNVILAVD
jgi:molybdate transport system regulatory protein